MNGNKILLDTNAVLYILNGDETLTSFLNGKALYLSIISEIELLSYKNISQKELKGVESFLALPTIENISEEIKCKTIEIRKSTNLKLPDCIIAATAITLNIPIITSDKQFSVIVGLDLVLYER